MGGGRGALIAGAILLCCSCLVGAVRCDAVSQEQEIQRLRSKVASLEDEVSWSKDETSQLEDVVREKTAQIAALVGGIDALQVRNAADDEPVMESGTRSALLEKQIERLGNDLEDQVRKGELLEARASEAERNVLELGQKLERLEKINNEQRKKIEELRHDLQHSEEKLSEVERRAKLTAEELAMVRGMWLPYWFASRSVHCQELASAKWHLHGKPVLDALTLKVAETLAHAQRLMEPHLQATQNKVVPVAKAHFNSLKNSAKPYASALATSCTRAYRTCRDAMRPCILKTQELADQYWQESKKLSKPYMSRIAAASEPHLSRASVALGPYVGPVTSAWTRLVASTRVYHRQVQKGVIRFLEDSELLNPPLAHRLAWWTASALFALPVFAIYGIFSVSVRKKIQARTDRGRSSSRKHTRRGDK